MKRSAILFFLVMFFSALQLQAQVVNVTGKIILKDKKGTIDPRGGEGAYVFLFNTADDAADFVAQYKNVPNGVVKAQYVSANQEGEFHCTVLAGGHIVIYNPSTKKDPINRTVKLSDANQRMDFVFSDDGITLEDVNVNAKRIQTSGPKARKARGFGRTLTWTCDNILIENQANHDSRLVVQPYAIDCQTEDTVKIMPAFVVEGNEYHNIQNRRMGYDFAEHDSVAPYYIDSLRVSKQPLQFTKTIVFEKPDPNKTYYCTAKMWLEDYTHVYWWTEGEFGSCFVSNPFKFMNFRLTGGKMDLDANEFYEVPTSELRENNKSLQVTFPIGESKMIDSPENQQQMSSLLSDLRSYGDRLAQVKVTGYASPDGNYDRNLKLAGERAQSVMQVIRGGVDARKVQLPPAQSVVYTWNDVVDSLVQRGYTQDAEQLSGIIKDGGSRQLQRIKEMIIYDTVISQILSNQRKMYCSYMYSINSQLKPEEAIAYYKSNPDYKEGGKYRFSHGDWFNILANTKDSVEQRKIVDRIYKEITTTESGYQYNAFAAYIANQKALQTIEAGVADTTILQPFIDLAAGVNVQKQVSYYNTAKYVVNRPAILANQAIMYMRLGDPQMAEFLVSKLPSSEPIRQEVGSYVSMMNWVLRMDDPSLTDKERTSGREGFNYVCAQDSVNNAILKAELWDDLGYDRSYVTSLVEKSMSDSDARKWYLLGMLKSHDAVVSDNTDEDDDYQPAFLDDMKKAIAMNPSYARYYATEANISKEVVEHYPIATPSAPQMAQAQSNVNVGTPTSLGVGLEKYQLETRWREDDEPFRHRWYDHMWFEGGLALESIHQKSTDKFYPLLSFRGAMGKQLGRWHSIRLELEVDYTKRKSDHFNYGLIGARFDYLFSLSQYLWGYDPDRIFDLATVLGVGVGTSKISRHDWITTPILYAGVNVRVKTGPYGYIGVEPFMSLKRNYADFSSKNWKKIDFSHGLYVSYIAYLNSNNTFNRPSPKPQSWRAPWFIEAGNGVTFVPSDGKTNKMGHDITFSVGKWFSPMIGVRAGIMTGDDIYRTNETTHYHRMFGAFRADAMFNPFGAGKHFSWDNKIGAFLFGGGFAGYMGSLGTNSEHRKTTVAAATLGAHLWYRLTPDLQIFMEPRYSYIRALRNGSVPNNDEWSLNLGLSMYVRTNHFRRQTESAPECDIDQDEKGWRAGVAGGISLLHFNRSCYNNKSGRYLNGLVYGEYHFDDYNALRLSYERFFHKQYVLGTNGNLGSVKGNNTLMALDYEVNLTNLLSGWRTDRRIQLGLYAGPGFSFTPGLHNPCFLLNGGAKLSGKVTDNIRIVFIPAVYGVTNMDYKLSVVTPRTWRYFETLNLGVEYKF